MSISAKDAIGGNACFTGTTVVEGFFSGTGALSPGENQGSMKGILVVLRRRDAGADGTYQLENFRIALRPKSSSRNIGDAYDAGTSRPP